MNGTSNAAPVVMTLILMVPIGIGCTKDAPKDSAPEADIPAAKTPPSITPPVANLEKQAAEPTNAIVGQFRQQKGELFERLETVGNLIDERKLIPATFAFNELNKMVTPYKGSPAAELLEFGSLEESIGKREAELKKLAIELVSPIIKKNCESVLSCDDFSEKSSFHIVSQTGRGTGDLGDGVFVRYQDGKIIKLEWFMGDDGNLFTTNGQTAAACPMLQDIAVAQRDKQVATAPSRGTDAKSYEGLYDDSGNFKFSDCSAFELRVADTVYREIYKNPNEPEKRAMRRVSRKIGLKPDVAAEIYGKAMSKCGWVAPSL